MRVQFTLAQTSVTHSKSKFGYFDLFGDMGGLLDLTIILVGIFLQPYNYSLFQYYSFKKMYKVKRPFRSLLSFLWEHNCSLCSTSKSSKLIQKCEETFDDELDLHDLIIKMRQLKMLIEDKDDSILNFDLRDKLKNDVRK